MFSKIKLQVRPNLVLFINWGTPFLAYRSNRCLVCNKSTIYRQSVLTKSTGIPSLIYFQWTDLSFLYLDQTYNSTFYGGESRSLPFERGQRHSLLSTPNLVTCHYKDQKCSYQKVTYT